MPYYMYNALEYEKGTIENLGVLYSHAGDSGSDHDLDRRIHTILENKFSIEELKDMYTINTVLHRSIFDGIGEMTGRWLHYFKDVPDNMVDESYRNIVKLFIGNVSNITDTYKIISTVSTIIIVMNKGFGNYMLSDIKEIRISLCDDILSTLIKEGMSNISEHNISKIYIRDKLSNN